uniref:Tubulin polyglutamylase TTLL4 n=1 Tax=Daphnia magna TaxID=35525 RepID=A0A0P6GEY3_9CRUS
MPKPRMIEKVVTDSGTECQHSTSILSDQHTNKVKPAVVKKKLVKKSLRKVHPAHTINGKSKASSYDRVSNSTCKKAKINGKSIYASIQSENDCDASSSVPSLASNFSGEELDSSESVQIPADDESCSYITEEECDAKETEPLTFSSDKADVFQPALRFSAFSGVPPYLNFCLHDEKVVELPWIIRRCLKWKLSTITPVVVRKTVVNSGFRVIKEPKDWIGTWGKHMKSPLFTSILEHQKVNHFPGTFQIGRKDRLWRNMQKMVAKYGNEEFGFLPQTFVLPHDLRLLRKHWSRRTTDVPWIIKPPASARGTGIQVIHEWNQLPRKKPLVVQSYVKNPYLINGTKFDIRLYVFVTSVNPLRIYLYENGLVRFASLTYSTEMNSLDDLYVHLTNYSVNKHCEGYVANEDANVCQGHKWTLASLWTYFLGLGVDVEAIKSSLSDIVIKTLLSVTPALNEMLKNNVANRYSCFELFGFDILLDSDLKPWLLEVNISPSLHSTSSLDLSVKGPLIKNVLNMARFQFPNNASSLSKEHLANYISTYFKERVCEKSSESDEGSQYCHDPSCSRFDLSEEATKKHEFYENIVQRAVSVPSGSCWTVQNQGHKVPTDIVEETNILDGLTRDDVQHLIETEDELSQSTGFTRVFPSVNSERYFRFMDKISYYDMLLNEWQKKFGCLGDRTLAIDYLKSHHETTKLS